MTEAKFRWMVFKVRGLEIKRETKPPFEQWEEAINGFDQSLQSSPFWRGDLFLKGTEWYGDTKATSIFDPLITNVKTWQNNASICRRISGSRRREALSYSHHAAVAYVNPEHFTKKSLDLSRKTPEQLQDHYLDVATSNGLSVRKLEALIRSDKNDEGEEINFQKRPLVKFLEQEANKIGNRKEEAEGDVYNLMQTAVDSLMDAHEIQKGESQLEEAA